MLAVDKGAKRTHRGGIRSMSAEITKSGMGLEDGYPRREWTKFADRELTRLADAAVQAALDGRRANTDSGHD